MSAKRKKAGLVFSWQKSFFILAPWRKGKGNRDVSLDSEVVLTKMKFFNNIQERPLIADDSASTISTPSVLEQEPAKVSQVNSHLDEKPRQPCVQSGSDYLAGIFSDSQLPRLYKFESEDSGVESPSGANSPSTPTCSEHSFAVHSRESSCDSCHLNSDPATLTGKLVPYAQSPEIKQEGSSVDHNLSTAVNTQEELSSSAVRVELCIGEDMDRDQCRNSGMSPEGDNKMSGQFEENSTVTEKTCLTYVRQYGKQSSTGACDDMMGSDPEPEPPWRSVTTDSLDEYMNKCCRISEAQEASSSPLGSGLGYLKHICELLEKIGRLQEAIRQLQRQIRSLRKDGRTTKTKEDFFQQHCCCGAASLAFHGQKIHSRSEYLSPCGALSDVSTIPEVTRHPNISTRRDVRRRSLSRRSYTEEGVHFTEGLPIPQRRVALI